MLWLLVFIIFSSPYPVRGQKDCTTQNRPDQNVPQADISALNDAVVALNSLLDGEIMKNCTKIMDSIVGWPKNVDDLPLKSPFYHFTQSFHTIGLPGVAEWPEALGYLHAIRPKIVTIRGVQEDINVLLRFREHCNATVILATLHNADSNLNSERCKALRLMFSKCKSETLVHKQTGKNEGIFVHRLQRACFETVGLIMRAYLGAVEPLTYNGKPANWDWSPLGLMWQDTLEYDLGIHKRLTVSFPAAIAKLQAEGKSGEAVQMQQHLDNINNRLQDMMLPYFYMYFNGNVTNLEAKRLTSSNGLNPMREFIRRLYYDGSFGGKPSPQWNFAQHYRGWQQNIKNFTRDMEAGVVDFYVQETTASIFFTRLLELPRSSDREYNRDGVLVGDGMWIWMCITNGLHNMRLAWDLMGAVLEELKCYLGKTYYFHLRPKAIQQTQLNISAGALYSGISKTMLKPCRLNNNNETDLVTPYCTRENHEICAPIAPFHPQQRPGSPHYGGLGLMKPRWIFKYDETLRKCVGRKDYVIMHYWCRCGFRLDCGSDLGVKMTCQLENNDVVRGQCRGSVGYPCKSLPLAPRKHNQTCASGYCDVKKNSCEDRPYIYLAKSQAISWTIKTLDKHFIFTLLCFNLRIFNWMFY